MTATFIHAKPRHCLPYVGGVMSSHSLANSAFEICMFFKIIAGLIDSTVNLSSIAENISSSASHARINLLNKILSLGEVISIFALMKSPLEYHFVT